MTSCRAWARSLRAVKPSAYSRSIRAACGSPCCGPRGRDTARSGSASAQRPQDRRVGRGRRRVEAHADDRRPARSGAAGARLDQRRFLRRQEDVAGAARGSSPAARRGRARGPPRPWAPARRGRRRAAGRRSWGCSGRSRTAPGRSRVPCVRRCSRRSGTSGPFSANHARWRSGGAAPSNTSSLRSENGPSLRVCAHGEPPHAHAVLDASRLAG